MDQLTTVLEIIEDVKTLNVEQKNSVMEYIKGLSTRKATSLNGSYRKQAINEIRAAFTMQAQF